MTDTDTDYTTDEDDLTILPIKEDPLLSKKFKTRVPNPLPQKCFRWAYIGSSGSGKSVCAFNVCMRFMKGAFSQIYIISPTLVADESARFVIRLAGKKNCYEKYNDKIIQGIIKQQETLKELGNMEHILIIADDFINSLPENSAFWPFFTKCRHYMCSIFVMSQVWRKIPNVARQQLTHISYFRNNHLELQKFIEEILINFTGNKRKAISIYNRCTTKPYEFAYLDLENYNIHHNFSRDPIYKKYNDDGTYTDEFNIDNKLK
mgnify:CR=1 FL=1|jgi:hypothetical protein|tara:strand:+ start:3880 stop:4665 length:786 start_codon:yes stop_codon:yes gene_type:complete